MSAATAPKTPPIPQTGLEARLAIRSGAWSAPTSGIAPGFVQGNLAILPAALATDFLRFCQLNPKPCPVLAVGAPGDWRKKTEEAIAGATVGWENPFVRRHRYERCGDAKVFKAPSPVPHFGGPGGRDRRPVSRR